MLNIDNFIRLFQGAVKECWDRPALSDFRKSTITYCGLAERIDTLDIIWKKAGLKPGDKIGINTKSSALGASVFMAAVSKGYVAVHLYNAFTPADTQRLVNHSDSKILYTEKRTFDEMNFDEMPQVLCVIDGATGDVLASRNGVGELYADGAKLLAQKYPAGMKPEDFQVADPDLDDVCAILYTSGSTGNPKGVMLTYRNFSANVDYSQRNVPAGDRMVSMLPMAHMYGLVIEFIYPLCNGTAIYWLGKAPTPATLLKAFADVKPYLLITVPLVMEKIYKSKVKPTLDKPLVKVLLKIPGINNIIYKKVKDGLVQAFGGEVQEFIMGGAALNPEVEKLFKRIKFPYLVGYGMTEACPLLAYEHWTKYVAGSCGKAVDVATVRIDSDDPEHIAGEIQAKGENITIGYFKNPEASANAFTEDGYLRTGDLGIMDKEGNIFIKGRSKSMILSANGQNIYPEELEAIINNQPYVAESVVVDRAGKIVALVYLDNDAIKRDNLDSETVSDIPEKIRMGANRQLPGYSQIAKVETVLTPFEKTPKMSIKRFLYK